MRSNNRRCLTMVDIRDRRYPEESGSLKTSNRTTGLGENHIARRFKIGGFCI
jgi:hypothetical protein